MLLYNIRHGVEAKVHGRGVFLLPLPAALQYLNCLIVLFGILVKNPMFVLHCMLHFCFHESLVIEISMWLPSSN